ncbi:MAG TPA: hypothetical protein DDW58_00890 [Clostridiaceae bacterium]|jgi:hypothetical protein|nr:hypothetical protein [Clostridiaceae bacterium]
MQTPPESKKNLMKVSFDSCLQGIELKVNLCICKFEFFKLKIHPILSLKTIYAIQNEMFQNCDN